MLDEFLTVSLANADTDGMSTVTVELEVPLQPKSPSPPRSSVSQPSSSAHAAAPAGMEIADRMQHEPGVGDALMENHAEPESGNRREETRYICRLGAEVYRGGSGVPPP